MAGSADDKPTDLPKLKPSERSAQTDAAFRAIVDREKAAEEAKTKRLREARLKRDAEQATD